MESENSKSEQTSRSLLIYGLIGGILGAVTIFICIYIVAAPPIQLHPTHIFIIIFFTLLCGLATIAGRKNNLGKVISTLLEIIPFF
jgi:ABC-type antimicrobial peptide transport system permease subunit